MQRLAMQEIVDLHIHVYEEIVYIGHYEASEDRKTLAFFQRLESLDAIVQKHVDLATKAATTWPLFDASLLLASCNQHCIALWP